MNGDKKLNFSQATLTGISDYFFKNSRKDKRNAPPLWMDDSEKADWKQGQRIAKKVLF